VETKQKNPFAVTTAVMPTPTGGQSSKLHMLVSQYVRLLRSSMFNLCSTRHFWCWLGISLLQSLRDGVQTIHELFFILLCSVLLRVSYLITNVE